LYLVADTLTIERGGRLVISDLSFTAEDGTALVLTGPNGVGKSTLLRAIAGLVRPVAGTFRLDGGDPERALPEDCHYFGHLDGIRTALTVSENIAFWQSFYGHPRTYIGGMPYSTLDEALVEVGLDQLADLPAAYLSAGQRRRLSFARLLAVHRPVWLLDEPTSALDAEAEANVLRLMNQHLALGGILIAATHVPLALQGGERSPAPIELRLTQAGAVDA
jgi:heme exporter protein A